MLVCANSSTITISGWALMMGRDVHLFELLAFVKEFASRNDGQSCYQRFGFGTSVRFDVADLYVHAHFEQLVCLLRMR